MLTEGQGQGGRGRGMLTGDADRVKHCQGPAVTGPTSASAGAILKPCLKPPWACMCTVQDTPTTPPLILHWPLACGHIPVWPIPHSPTGAASHRPPLPCCAVPPPPRQGLLELGLVPEEWGGNTPMVNVSAKKGTGEAHGREVGDGSRCHKACGALNGWGSVAAGCPHLPRLAALGLPPPCEPLWPLVIQTSQPAHPVTPHMQTLLHALSLPHSPTHSTHPAAALSRNKGVDDLLQMLAWVAEEKGYVANPSKPAAGTVIEAHLDRKRGAVATLLVQVRERRWGRRWGQGRGG